MANYIVQTATANMPGSCWGRYGRVALIEVDSPEIQRVSMISTRARHVIRIVRLWDRVFWGTSNRCAFQQAIMAAEDERRRMEMR